MKRILALFMVILLVAVSQAATGVWAASETVTVPDANLAAAIRARLGLSSSATLTKSLMEQLEGLDLKNKSVKNLSGLEAATNLLRLYADGNQITDTSVLSKLTSLEILNISGNPLSGTDLSWAASLPNLQHLYIADQGGTGALTSLKGIEACKESLMALDISYNKVTDISALKSFPRLTMLSVSGNRGVSLAPLQNAGQMNLLMAENAGINNVEFLAGLANMARLELSGNALTNITPLAFMRSLTKLGLQNNPLNLKTGDANVRTIDTLKALGATVTHDAIGPADPDPDPEPDPDPDRDPDNPRISSAQYVIDRGRGIITGIDENSTVQAVLSGLSKSPAGASGVLQAVDSGGNTLLDSAVVGTGVKLRLIVDGTVVDELTVVIYGDINGDGKITISDYVMIREHILGFQPLTEPQFIAANVAAHYNKDPKDVSITISDYVVLREHILGYITINQK